MRAVSFEADGTVAQVNVPAPSIAGDEVLVQVLAAGVCHTDLHILDEVRSGERTAIIPGHEIAGRITKAGPDVYMAYAGDVIVVHFEQPCGQCRQCRRKRTNLCRDGHSLGFDVPGGYAEYVKARQDTVLPLPPTMDPALAAPLGCSGATAYRAVVALGNAGEEDLVVVLGAGGVGLSAVQIAKSQGARVVAVDSRESARTAALQAGAESALAPDDAGSLRDADVVVDFVGRGATLSLGRSILGVGGKYVAVAGGSESVPMSPTDIMEYGRAFVGSYSSTMADLARVVSLAGAGRFTPVVTRRSPLEDAASVLQDLRDGKIVGRAVLEPTTA